MPFFRVKPYECYFVYHKGTDIMKSSHPAGSVFAIESEEIDASQVGKLEECDEPIDSEIVVEKEDGLSDPFGDNEGSSESAPPEVSDAKEAAKKLLKSKIG